MPGSASHFYLPETLSVLSIEDNMSFIGSTLRMYLAVCWSWVRVSSGWDSYYFPYSPPLPCGIVVASHPPYPCHIITEVERDGDARPYLSCHAVYLHDISLTELHESSDGDCVTICTLVGHCLYLSVCHISAY